jgi:hypothetical protein
MDISENRTRSETQKTFVMKQDLHISAAFDQPDFLEHLVEKLAYRRNESGYGSAEVPAGWEALEISSTEAYASGDVKLSFHTEQNREEHINMPFITCFLFTCKKGKEGDYKLAWSNSLS